jgi:hypothetical protein
MKVGFEFGSSQLASASDRARTQDPLLRLAFAHGRARAIFVAFGRLRDPALGGRIPRSRSVGGQRLRKDRQCRRVAPNGISSEG